MAYQRPPFRTPFSAFALQNPMPIPGQFFNTGPPIAARPLIGGIPNPGFRLPPQLPIPPNLPRPRLPPQNHQNKFRLAAPPKTTAFVGNISEEVDTTLLQKILEECGHVNSFRRLEGANGKLQAFGFCEFNHPDATRRALRLLNGFNLGGKPLLIKVEEKVMNQILEYMNALRQDNGVVPLPPGSEIPLSDEDRDGDIIAKKLINEHIEAVDKNLLREPAPPPPPEPKKETKKVSSSSESEEDRRRDDRERSRRRKHHRSRSRSPKRRTRSRSRSPRRRRERSPRDDRSKKSRRRRHSDSEEDEAKRRERQKIKERENAYQKRLKKWEEKEIRFAREVEKDRERERQRQKTLDREAKKLQTFHEDYDDDVDDAKYYRGDTLIQRRRIFDQQLEQDLNDRKEELAEFEQIKNEILAANPGKAKNVEEEARRRKEKEETKINIKLGLKSNTPSTFTPDDGDSRPATFKIEPMNNAGWESVPSPSTSSKIPSLGKKINVQAATVAKNELFDDGEDEEVDKKKMKLQPFTISSEERIAILTPEERKRMIRDLIDKIPKSREQIFAYSVKWEHLDDAMVESRIRPWIIKKVNHFIGEEEPALVSFISDCVKKQTDPKKLVLDLSMVFDEEAESFITKMWRLIIYETEARAKGLSALPSSSTTANSQSSA